MICNTTIRRYHFCSVFETSVFSSVYTEPDSRHRSSKERIRNNGMTIIVTTLFAIRIFTGTWRQRNGSGGGGSWARHDGGCGDRKIVRWGSAAAANGDRHAHPAPPPAPISPPTVQPRCGRRRRRRRRLATGAAAVITAEVSTPFVWRCYILKPRAGNGKFVRTGMCTVLGSFSVDLTTSTSMVIHRALQVSRRAPRIARTTTVSIIVALKLKMSSSCTIERTIVISVGRTDVRRFHGFRRKSRAILCVTIA